jgi:hypothetical protein
MALGFPPKPAFPLAIDTDRTLFLVHNTSEAALAENNPAWSEEIEIVPVGINEQEIWGDNGFANIAGEMFYYDAVEKDVNGKIFKLKRCLRNFSGSKTKYNYAGEMVRGFVVAEHHNQIVDTIIAVEEFVGKNFDTNEATLDWRIRNIQDEEVCVDDYECPEVDFQFDFPQSYQEGNIPNKCEGLNATFNITINGRYSRYTLDFGDGNVTSDLSGEHQYGSIDRIDPVVTVANEKCETVMTMRPRTEEPVPAQVQPFDIPLPEIPDFSPFVTPEIVTPSTTLTLPQIVFPWLDINIPSFDIVIPSFLIPSEIIVIGMPSTIYFEQPIIPDTIYFEQPIIPDTIYFGSIPEFPTTIYFGSIPDVNLSVDVSVDWGSIPYMTMEWGSIPYMTMYWGSIPSYMTMNWGSIPYMTMYWGSAPSVTINWNATTIPLLSVYWGSAPSVSIDWNATTIPLLSVYWGSPAPISVIVEVVCTPAAMRMRQQKALKLDNFDFANYKPSFDFLVGFFALIKAIIPSGTLTSAE